MPLLVTFGLKISPTPEPWLGFITGCWSPIAALIKTRPTTVPASFHLAEHFRPAIDKPQYQAHIARIQDYILAGDCYQVNYAQRFEATLEGDAWSAYRYVRTLLAGGFSGFLRTAEDHAILSLSPERPDIPTPSKTRRWQKRFSTPRKIAQKT